MAAVLTIIMAWQRAEAPKADVSDIATFTGPWSDYCRQPLIWLGLPDPATALLKQLNHSPDQEALASLFEGWYEAFGSVPTTVRKAKTEISRNEKLLDAIPELYLEDMQGNINPTRLGQLLGKNANRIIGGYQLQPANADGRKGWRVVRL